VHEPELTVTYLRVYIFEALQCGKILSVGCLSKEVAVSVRQERRRSRP
jgi:hypothetical protein